MRKLVFLLAIVAVAAAPSLASAKKMHYRHHAKQAKVEQTYAGPNGNTVHLFHDMVRGK